MISFFAIRTNYGGFRLRWRGYDPEQVDEFMRQTTAQRQRLEEDLAQLEAFVAGQTQERRRELERLTKLRMEVASCLENSIGALRTATEDLSKVPVPPAQQPPSQTASRLAPRQAPASPFKLGWGWVRPSWMSRGRAWGLAGVLFLFASSAAMLSYRSNARETLVPLSVTPAVATPSDLGKPVTAAVVANQSEGLVLAITARRQCWIRTHIDGGQPLERLLRTGETIMLRANEEVVMRVGDAGALSLLINNRPAKPLGASGQVVTARIARSNYLSLLAEGSAPLR